MAYTPWKNTCDKQHKIQPGHAVMLRMKCHKPQNNSSDWILSPPCHELFPRHYIFSPYVTVELSHCASGGWHFSWEARPPRLLFSCFPHHCATCLAILHYPPSSVLCAQQFGISFWPIALLSHRESQLFSQHLLSKQCEFSKTHGLLVSYSLDNSSGCTQRLGS